MTFGRTHLNGGCFAWTGKLFTPIRSVLAMLFGISTEPFVLCMDKRERDSDRIEFKIMGG